MSGHNVIARRRVSAIAYQLPELWMELKDRHLLRQFMETQNVSGRDLARIAGWKSHTYLQRLLRGEVKTLETEPALRIAHHFGVPVTVLFLTKASTDDARNVRRKSA